MKRAARESESRRKNNARSLFRSLLQRGDKGNRRVRGKRSTKRALFVLRLRQRLSLFLLSTVARWRSLTSEFEERRRSSKAPLLEQKILNALVFFSPTFFQFKIPLFNSYAELERQEGGRIGAPGGGNGEANGARREPGESLPPPPIDGGDKSRRRPSRSRSRSRSRERGGASRRSRTRSRSRSPRGDRSRRRRGRPR